ncbi:MAG TPA: membrane dipeptidase [Terriglobales bacterium]|nr:membrane dipeptidase [Terriglobales bacterium]
MNRRDFLVFIPKLSAAAWLLPRLRDNSVAETPAEIDRLYRRVIVIDSLCAPPFLDPEHPANAEALAAARHCGITAVNHTVSEPTFEDTVNSLAAVESLVERYPDLFMIIRKYSEIAQAKRGSKIGIMLGFQYSASLEEDQARIGTFRKLGVRIMQLTYNKHGAFGDGCLEAKDGGLTGPGRLAVKTMNDSGVAVDLSHCGYRTTSDAVRESSKPVLITHSGCAAVYAHPRSKPDDILKALADRGGYFGVYLMPYLVASPTVPTREHVINHLVHAINVCGADHVGIGSDGGIEKVVLTDAQRTAFEADIARRKQLGIGAPGEDRYPYVPDLNGPDHMEIIAAELAKRGQSAAVIEKVLGVNFQRVLGEIWGTA